MDKLRGKYVAFRPRMFNLPEDEVSIQLKNYDFNSEEFYSDVLAKNAKEFNYVIIAVGNDEFGITLAVNIFNYLRKERNDLKNLRILVRSYSKQKKTYMQKIIDHYNNGDDDSRINPVIRLFGKPEEIYSYDMLVNEDFIKKAKRFHQSYQQMTGETGVDWDTRRQLAIGVVKKQGDKIISVETSERKTDLNDLCKLRRQEWQDLCNTLHMGTKMDLLKNSFPTDYDWVSFLSRFMYATSMPCQPWNFQEKYVALLPKEQIVIENLAILEHLRWNASHEVLGYEGTEGTRLHTCDERRMKHNCLRAWQELDEESRLSSKPDWECNYKKYDFAVVDTTIHLCADELIGAKT